MNGLLARDGVRNSGPMHLWNLGNHAKLARARALIERCSYWRRHEDLEDAETAAAGWPNQP